LTSLEAEEDRPSGCRKPVAVPALGHRVQFADVHVVLLRVGLRRSMQKAHPLKTVT
jgi:hypothetical protein